jgi:hypothetical protein
MKNTIFALIFSLILVSCGQKSVDTADAVVKTDVETKSVDPKISYNNPFVFVGSDFGSFINVLYRQGKFDEMVKWTSISSVEKFGKEDIKTFYKNLSFGFELGRVKSDTEDGVLNYPDATIKATRTTIRIAYTIENDSCKLVLNDLTSGFFK